MALVKQNKRIFYDICRLCLTDEGKCSIFDKTDLIDNIYNCTKVKISLSDKLPPKICFKCFEIIIKANELGILARMNDAKLKSFFSILQNEMEEPCSGETKDPVVILCIDNDGTKLFSIKEDEFDPLGKANEETEIPISFTTKLERCLNSRSRSRSPLLKLQMNSDLQTSNSRFHEDDSDVSMLSDESDTENYRNIERSSDCTGNSARHRGRKGRGCSASFKGRRAKALEFSDVRVTSGSEMKSVIDDNIEAEEIQEQSLFVDNMKRVAHFIEKNRYEIDDSSVNRNIYDLSNVDNSCDSLLQTDEDFDFEWSSIDSFKPQEEPFLVEHIGSVESYTSAYDAFRAYWDDDILKYIADQTNLYATKIESNAFQLKWCPTNSHEILCLFAFWMALGIVRMPSIKSCFSTNPILKVDIFPRIFTQRRYTSLLRALNFIDLESEVPNDSDISEQAHSNVDSLSHLRPIIQHLNKKFQNKYVLSKQICIDESMTQWKGKLDIRHPMPNNPARFGIKTIELCESSTGYLWSFVVDTSKKSGQDESDEPAGQGYGTNAIKKLVGSLLNKGYTLYMDKKYNSPSLARWLKRNYTDCVGTLGTTPSDVPPSFYKTVLNEGQSIGYHSGDVCILSWQGNKRTNMISTCHGSEFQKSNSRLPEPQVIVDHKKYMGGVDLKDDMLEPYLMESKRCSRWYMKLFKRLLNVSISNTRILLQSSTQSQQNHLSFRLDLVESILDKHLPHTPHSTRRFTPLLRYLDQSSSIVPQNKHWLVRLPSPGASVAVGNQFRKRCVFCLNEGRKSKKTGYECEACRVPLCVDYCMKAYHLQY